MRPSWKASRESFGRSVAVAPLQDGGTWARRESPKQPSPSPGSRLLCSRGPDRVFEDEEASGNESVSRSQPHQDAFGADRGTGLESHISDTRTWSGKVRKG